MLARSRHACRRWLHRFKSGAAVEHENASSIIDWLAQPRPSATSEDELADVRGLPYVRDSCAREPVPSRRLTSRGVACPRALGAVAARAK